MDEKNPWEVAGLERQHQRQDPMISDLAFFSFVGLADASLHDAYNRWHQLDHRPENLALPGVGWGDRWVRAPGPATPSKIDSAFEGTDFVAMYWFRSPVDESVAE